uniref:Uncharacterized protein n=1 Tax=Janibacter limosus TaxID=53458 RepID=A0AC61U1I7_9MICO|nr:hypothetical protein [Janibacter limosus]
MAVTGQSLVAADRRVGVMPGNTTMRYPLELKVRAVRMVAERPQEESEWSAMQRIAPLLGIGTPEPGSTVRVLLAA